MLSSFGVSCKLISKMAASEDDWLHAPSTSKSSNDSNRYELHEIIELLGEDALFQDVVLIPPDDGEITEEDSGDEAEADMNRLPPRVLRSVVEVNIDKPNTDDDELDAIEEVENVELFSTKKGKSLKSGKKITKCSAQKHSDVHTVVAPPAKKVKQSKKCMPQYNWSSNIDSFINKKGKGDTDETTYDKTVTNNNYSSTMECFELMFSTEIIQLICDKSNEYALQRNHSLNVSPEEIKVYISILLLTGYLTPKYMRMLWEVKSDTHNELVSQSMRRNRFLEIQQYLHLCNNLSLPQNDKFGKLRDYFDILNKNFIKNFEQCFSSHLSVDETMVPYYGRHGTKQHIHGKPIRFGYKLWSLATRNGYLISFEPYQGAKSSPLPNQERYGLGAAVVLELESRLPKELGPYNLYFDNFFTSVPLLKLLSERNTGGTGTIRENRMEKCPIESKKEMKKGNRGSMSFRTTEDFALVSWHDNSIVTLASNCHSILPISKVDRIGTVQGKRSKIQVECPSLVCKYNKYMCGVDRFDENVQSLRVGLRGRKWWYPLFAFGLDAACQNAWLLFKAKTGESHTYCEFRRAVVQSYCGVYGIQPKKSVACGVPVTGRVLPEVRLSGEVDEHVKQDCSQRRCAKCHNRTRIMCKKCNVGLHVQCWYEYHTRE